MTLFLGRWCLNVLVSEEGWLSRCSLNIAWCNILLNALRGGLPPSDLAVCQAQITQWEEHQRCQFLLLSLTLVPTASLNSPRVPSVPSLDTSKTSHLNIEELVMEVFMTDRRLSGFDVSFTLWYFEKEL